jgi:hypothetical protein
MPQRLLPALLPTDIRETALIACVAAVLGVLMPSWNAAQTMFAIESIRPWSAPLIVLMCCFTAIMPTFYFALYRNQGTLHFSKRMRLLSLTAAIILGIITAAELPRWIESFGSYWADIRLLDWNPGAEAVSIVAGEPGTYTQVAALLGEFSILAYIMLLIAFFRHAGKSDGDIPNSRMLAIMTKIALIAGGLVVAGCVVRLLFLPFVNSQIRDFAIQVGRMPPRLLTMMADTVRTLLVQACFFTAPYVVYRSRVRRVEAAERAISTA